MGQNVSRSGALVAKQNAYCPAVALLTAFAGVAELIWDQAVAGSDPVAPTLKSPRVTRRDIGDRATDALGIHPGPIEAARASLPFGQHVARAPDPLHARL